MAPPALLAAALLCASCASTDLLFRAVEARICSTGLACGVVLPGDDSSHADSCAVSAFQRGVPFWVGYGSCASDGMFESFYFVSAGESRLRVIRYETAHTRASSRFGALRPVVDRECVPEIYSVAPGHLRLGCRGEAEPLPSQPLQRSVASLSAPHRGARKPVPAP